MAPGVERDSVLPWPECLGTFDEESCRYFLRELGQRMVQYYPFSVGIEEVYSQIIDEYGFDGAPDAISVLQELLEDDSTAAGNGDDGDIWRSWRHSWRHRNSSSRDPYIPQVRGHILPPPTSIRIRILKNANFVAHQLSQAKECVQNPTSPLLKSPDSQRTRAIESRPSQTWTYRSTYQIPGSAATEEHGSRFHEVSPDYTQEESSHCIQLDVKDLSDEGYLLPSQRYDVSSSSVYPRSTQELPAQFPRKHNFPFNLVSPRRRSVAISSQHDRSGSSGVSVILEDGEAEASSLTIIDATLDNTSPASSIVREGGDVWTKQTPSSAHVGSEKVNRFSLPSDLGVASREATPTRKRASHRQARMIDGNLFQGKTRKGRFVESDSIDTGSAVKEDVGNETRPLDSRSTKQHTRGSWLRNVWTRFHGEQRRTSDHSKLRKQHSSFASCGLVGSPPSNRPRTFQPDSFKIVEMKQTTSTSRLGLDGTCEERLNKPLPLSPGDIQRPSMQSDIHRTFFGRSPKPVLPSPELTNVPIFPQDLSPRKDVDLSSLVSATMTGPQELSPKEKSWTYRFSDSSLKSGPSSPSSFAAFAKKNPYHDSSEPSTPTTLIPPAPLAFQKQQISSIQWPFRTTQDLQRQVTVDESQASDRAMSSYSNDVEPCNESSRQTVDAGDHRGRRPSTPMIPTIAQNSRFDPTPPKTPPPRSRSPVKRLIGMVKSMSTNQISDNSESPMRDTPGSANKRKWKELSNKLRHGFLTADIEQLEQEEMMEQYTSNCDVHILTPPPSRRRAPFPVSIKSSGQSKLWSELEFMLLETCNNFLKDELEQGRLSRESIIRAKRQWQARNRPQVIEFYYDQATQYEIIIGNLRTVKLYSDYAEDAVMLNSVLHQWKILIRELSVKTLCMPDSIVRRWLHDGRRVLELLGAPPISLAHLDRLSGLCFAVFGSAEKQRAKQRSRADTAHSHRRSASDGSQNTLVMHEQALMNHSIPGNLQAPPLPTPRSMGNISRKVTPQEQRIAQQSRKSTERERPVFTNGGRGYSKSLTATDERSRFAMD